MSGGNFRRKIQIAVLCTLTLLVWILLSLPVIFYHISTESSEHLESENSSRNSSVCSTTFQYSTNTEVCISELYRALESSNCFQDLDKPILVMDSSTERINQIVGGLSLLGASDDCRQEVIPFLCLYSLGLCTHSEVHIQPDSGQCEKIRDSICMREWATALTLNIDLPDCSIFPAERSLCTNSSNISVAFSGKNFNTEVWDNATRECSDGFYRRNDSTICRPNCYTFKQQSRTISTFIDVILIIASSVGFVAAVLAIVVSLIRYKRMLKFPSVFIVYMVIDGAVNAALVLISFAGRKNLFCASQDLIENLQHVSSFCIISGILFTYIIYQLALWWLFHTLSFFWKVYFPFHARSFEAKNRMKYVHLSCIILGTALPAVPVVTIIGKFAMEVDSSTRNETFLSGGAGFGITRYPPILCTGRNADATFYSLVLHIEVIVLIGCTALLFILWSLLQQSRSKVNDNSTLPKFSTAEKKLIVIFIYYVILATEALVTFTISTRNSTRILKELEKYFFCQQNGHDPEKSCSLSEIEKLTYPSLTALSYVLLGLLPVANLVFIINAKEIKTILRGCSWKIYSTHPKTTKTSYATSKV